jgi:hypothetical protein
LILKALIHADELFRRGLTIAIEQGHLAIETPGARQGRLTVADAVLRLLIARRAP